MASPSPRSPNGEDRLPVYGTKVAGKDDTAVLDVEKNRRTRTKTPEPAEQRNGTATPNPPAVLEPFDWDDFEVRYEKALAEAEGQEREVLKEAESLFRVSHSALFYRFNTTYTKQNDDAYTVL